MARRNVPAPARLHTSSACTAEPSLARLAALAAPPDTPLPPHFHVADVDLDKGEPSLFRRAGMTASGLLEQPNGAARGLQRAPSMKSSSQARLQLRAAEGLSLDAKYTVFLEDVQRTSKSRSLLRQSTAAAKRAKFASSPPS